VILRKVKVEVKVKVKVEAEIEGLRAEKIWDLGLETWDFQDCDSVIR
jgi:hypothetical protein